MSSYRNSQDVEMQPPSSAYLGGGDRFNVTGNSSSNSRRRCQHCQGARPRNHDNDCCKICGFFLFSMTATAVTLGIYLGREKQQVQDAIRDKQFAEDTRRAAYTTGFDDGQATCATGGTLPSTKRDLAQDGSDLTEVLEFLKKQPPNRRMTFRQTQDGGLFITPTPKEEGSEDGQNSEDEESVTVDPETSQSILNYLKEQVVKSEPPDGQVSDLGYERTASPEPM